MRKVSVYMSSTDFASGIDDEFDVNWKGELQNLCNSLVDQTQYHFSCYDPLQIISDKAEIVSSDIQHIICSDFIVCYLPKTKLSIGTLMELQYSCLHKYKDNIILIDRYKIHRNHPWIKYWIKHIVDNEHEAITKMLNILGNGDFKNLKESF